jgi:hypothetical protein
LLIGGGEQLTAAAGLVSLDDVGVVTRALA